MNIANRIIQRSRKHASDRYKKYEEKRPEVKEENGTNKIPEEKTKESN